MKTVLPVIGDRVRAKTSCEGEGTVTQFFKASGEPGTSDALSVQWDSGMRSGIAVASVNVICERGCGKQKHFGQACGW